MTELFKAVVFEKGWGGKPKAVSIRNTIISSQSGLQLRFKEQISWYLETKSPPKVQNYRLTPWGENEVGTAEEKLLNFEACQEFYKWYEMELI